MTYLNKLERKEFSMEDNNYRHEEFDDCFLCKHPALRYVLTGLLIFLGAFCAFYVVSDWHFKRMIDPVAQMRRMDRAMMQQEKRFDKMERRALSNQERIDRKAFKQQRNAQTQSQQTTEGGTSATPATADMSAAQSPAPATDTPGTETSATGASAPAAPYESFIPQDNAESRRFYPLEKLIMELLVRYGERVMCNVTDDEGHEVPLTVVEYICNDLQIDDLQFHNPLHRRMLAEAAAHIHDEGFHAEHYFSTHPDPDISRYAVSLVNERYTLSKYHTKNQKIASPKCSASWPNGWATVCSMSKIPTRYPSHRRA